MSLQDPLAEFRLGEIGSLDELRGHVAPRDGEVVKTWRRGGEPVVLTQRALFFVYDETGYRVPKGQVRSFGLVRASSKRLLRWGLALYLLAMVPLFLLGPALGGLPILLGVAMAITGGVLVVKGFLNKHVLVQLEDDRIPPLIVENGRWRSLRNALRGWR